MTGTSIFAASRRVGRALAAGKAVPFGIAAQPRGNKFSARVTACSAGHSHASKAEAFRCAQLRLLERGHAISDLEQQPKFRFVIDGRPVTHENGRQVVYTADFRYVEGGRTIVEDVKGKYRDDAWTLRKAFFRACFPDVVLREVTA